MQGMGGTGGMEGLLGGEVAPTAEQMMAMIEQLQAAGHNLEDISPDLAELMKNVKRDKGEMADPDLASESIEPEPGFVVKTVDTNTGTKVFINVCCHDKVPAPGTGWSSGMVPEEVQNALARRDEAAGGSSAEADAESLRFPLSAGQPKVDIDKKGERCVTFDCILNTEIVRQASAHRPLKAFLVELCIAWVAQKSKMALDEKFKLPKMRYKGEVIEKQNIRVDRKPLVCEVKDLPDEPSFPLVTKKLDKEKIKAKAKAKEEAARKQASASGAGSAPAGKAKPPTSNAAPPPGSSGFNFSGKQVMRHEVEYVGRPVTEVFVTVSVPPPQPSSEDATSTAQRPGGAGS
ncbi:hypothetical protein FOA52_014974 [Chlamydomonas sp. UWO 241]|nr:hypothetical protein FOA52_014974 [Chlamydomonas sp. UWO 241]